MTAALTVVVHLKALSHSPIRSTVSYSVSLSSKRGAQPVHPL